MLVSALAGNVTRPVKAEPDITLYAVLSTEEYFGWQAGYHDIMIAIQTELAKIGINLELTYWDPGTIYDICWFSYWDQKGPPPTGWDLTCGEIWSFPHGLLWATELAGTPEGMPPVGFNICPYLNPKATSVIVEAERTIDPYKRQALTWKWQELLMHDVPAIELYYPEQLALKLDCFQGYDVPGIYWNDLEHAWLNHTKQTELGLTPGVLTVVHEEDMWGATSPIFLLTYTQEFMTYLTHDTLYKVTRDPWPPEEAFLNGSAYTTEGITVQWPFVIRPDLASDMPTYSADYKTVTVPLRDDVWWVEPVTGANTTHQFTAEDVEFTYEAILDPATQSPGYPDIAPIIESVERINDTAVQFNLKNPHADFELLLSNGWGGQIIPKHVLGNVPHGLLRTHETNKNPEILPGTGPFYFYNWELGDHVELRANPFYSRPMTGTIDKVFARIVVDPASRRSWLVAKDAELVEGLVMSVTDRKALAADPDIDGILCPRFSTNPLRMNLNNPILANRYVRMAIAHAIPYKKIIEDILPGWGVEGLMPTVPAIYPWHTYTRDGVTVSLYNNEIEPFEYNLTKAQQYLDMYLYSTDSLNWDLGPVGDADQSGLVDFTDWSIWRANPGIYPAGTWPIDTYPTWPFTIDPDWTNDNKVDGDDVFEWGLTYGTEHPFPGAK